MNYDPASFYPIGYDHRGMPISMHGGSYDMPMDMYLPQSSSYSSSRSRNSADVRVRKIFSRRNQQSSFFLSLRLV